MRKILTLFASICVLALSLTCFAIFVGADDGVNYTGNIASVTPYISQYNSAEDNDTKISTAKTISEYLRMKPIDPKSNGYSEFASSLNEVMYDAASIYLATFNIEAKMYENKQIIGWVENFIGNCTDTDALSGYTAFAADLAEKKQACADKYEDLRSALQAQTPMGEQENDLLYAMNSFDTDANNLTMSNSSTSGVSYGIKTEADGNRYYNTDSLNYAASKFTYAVISGTTKYDKFVLEFDVSYFTENLILQLNTTEDGLASGGRVGAYFLDITSSSIQSSGHELFETKEKLDMPSPVVPTKWTHITLVYEDITYTVKLYVDYEYVGSYYAPSTEAFNLTHFRFAFTPSNIKVGFAVDNIVVYEGTGIRELGKLAKMSEVEKFIYLTDYLLDEANNGYVQSRVWAYAQTSSLLPSYWNSETESFVGVATDNTALQQAVLLYLSLDTAELNRQNMDFNSKEFISMVDKLCALDRSFAQIDAIGKTLSDIDKFLISKGSSINSSYEGYAQAQQDYKDIADLYRVDILSYEFAQIMNEFISAISYENKLKAYNKAKNFLVENDILSTSFFDTTINETALNAAIESYNNANEILNVLLRTENTKRIIAYMTYAYDYQDMTAWEANFEKLSYMMSRTREILKNEENYIADYEGMPEAIEWFNLVNPYFYNALQKQHIKYLDSLHARYKATDSYVEKLTVCALVEEYLDENDIDYSNIEISRIMIEHKIFADDLEGIRVAYEQELKNNSSLFVNAVTELSVEVGYAKRLLLFNVASQYYYAMNVEVEGVEEAVKYYDEVRKELAFTLSMNEEFVARCSIISSAQTLEAKYIALKNAYVYIEYVSEDIEGVSEALEVYNAVCNEYNALTQTPNAELKETVDCVVGVRFNCPVQRILLILLENYR